MASEAQRAACRRYYERTKKDYKAYMLRFSRTSDADIIEKLEQVPNKTEYIRSIIRGNNGAESKAN